jgi:hypothetical protein
MIESNTLSVTSRAAGMEELFTSWLKVRLWSVSGSTTRTELAPLTNEAEDVDTASVYVNGMS